LARRGDAPTVRDLPIEVVEHAVDGRRAVEDPRRWIERWRWFDGCGRRRRGKLADEEEESEKRSAAARAESATSHSSSISPDRALTWAVD